MKTYLDIETSFEQELTVIGLFNKKHGFFQLIGSEITPGNLLHMLRETETIVTYNGERFDLPMIFKRLGVDLRESFGSRDLMYDCWQQGLKGGLKKVEQTLGIARETDEVDGYQAMVLWARFRSLKDDLALRTLLKYNRDDVLNLPILEEMLETGYYNDNSQLDEMGERCTH